jgi:uncharacterized protein (DUF2384 family)
MGNKSILIPVQEEKSPVPGAPLRPAADLFDATERKSVTPVAIKAFRQITDQSWALSEAQALSLLGGVASSTYHAWRTAPEERELDQDTLTRISLVIGIFRALHSYFSNPLADNWVTYGNRAPMFSGRAPIDLMIHEGIPGMLQVRRMLDGWRVGN